MTGNTQHSADPGNSDAGPANTPGQGAMSPGIAPPDAVFGQVIWLMMNMPQYRHVFLTDLEWMVLPPILLNQHRLFRVGNRVVAFAAWAYLSAAAEVRLQEPNPRLAPIDWKSGDRLWLIDLYAPFGHQELALKELRETTFKGKTFRMHRRAPDGKKMVEVVSESGPVPHA